MNLLHSKIILTWIFCCQTYFKLTLRKKVWWSGWKSGSRNLYSNVQWFLDPEQQAKGSIKFTIAWTKKGQVMDDSAADGQCSYVSLI